MDRFCRYCGSKIDQTTGGCMKCTSQKLIVQQDGPTAVLQNQAPGNVRPNGNNSKKGNNKKIVIIAVAVIIAMILLTVLLLVGIINANKVDLPDSYKEIVQEYQEIISGDKATNSGRFVNTKLVEEAKEEEEFEVCYSVYDINGDDVEELIIGGHEKDSKDVETYDVFTTDRNQEPVQLFDTNNFEENTEMGIYGDVIKITSETPDIQKKIEYYKLPQYITEVEKTEEYFCKDDTYYEVIDDKDKEITEKEFEEADNKYDNQETDFSWVTIVIKKDTVEKDGKVLSPESAVKIYMMNEDVWKHVGDYPPMQGYGYCLLDLDFDGVLELIRSSNDGSGRYSYNTYYKINPKTQKVEQLESKEADDGGVDLYYLGEENTLLLKDTTSGKLFYYSMDYNGFGESWYKVYIDNKAVQTDMLYGTSFAGPGIYGAPPTDDTYYHYSKNQYVEISKNEFEKLKTDLFEDNTDMNLSWSCIDGMEFDALSAEQKEKKLSEAYCAFSYDGFSFDNLSTYDIEFEKSEQTQLTGEVAIYSEYLKNGGIEKCTGEAADDIYDVQSCLIDLNDDGVSELLLHIGVNSLDIVSNPEQMSYYYLLLSIENGVVTKKLLTYDDCVTGGGEWLTIKYDTVLSRYVIHHSFMAYDATPGILVSEKAYEYNGKTLIPYVSSSILLEESSMTQRYKVNDKLVSQAEYEKSKARFTESTDSKYQMKKGSYSNPLGV